MSAIVLRFFEALGWNPVRRNGSTKRRRKRGRRMRKRVQSVSRDEDPEPTQAGVN